MVFDCAAEQGVCTGERRSETCAHVRSDAGRSGFWLSDRDPSGIPSAVVQPRPPVVAAAGPLDASRDSVDLDGGPSSLRGTKVLLLTRLRVPCNLHRQPAKRSPAVKSGPTGPSDAVCRT